MSDETVNKTLYEKLLIQFMFNDAEVREKLLPYLNPEVFSSYNNSQIIKEIQKFMERHNLFPKVNELKLFIERADIYQCLLDIMDIDSNEYGKDFILSELEEFYRKSLLSNVILKLS